MDHRFPGADTNPRLAAAALIAAVLEGIASGTDPGPPVKGDVNARTDLARPPASLGEALAAFETSHFARGPFGSEIADHYAGHARAEWAPSLNAVTDWGLVRGFGAV